MTRVGLRWIVHALAALTIASSGGLRTMCEVSCVQTAARSAMPSCHHVDAVGPTVSAAHDCSTHDITLSPASSSPSTRMTLAVIDAPVIVVLSRLRAWSLVRTPPHNPDPPPARSLPLRI